MIVTDNELHAVHAAVQKALEELPPVVFGLAEFDAAAEDGPLSVRGDADGRKDRTGDNGTAVSDLFVPGIEDKVGDLTDGPVPPGFEFLVELGGSSADLGRSDLEAQSFSTMAVTFRVLTPRQYISATARIMARSLRTPRSRLLG
jgi:hypothetical protein